MDSKEKLLYFENHVKEIWQSKNNSLASFIGECLKEQELIDAFQYWPDEIKIKIVERHLKEINPSK